MINHLKDCVIIIILIWLTITNCFSQNNNLCQSYTTIINTFNDNCITPIHKEKFDKKSFKSELIKTLDPNFVIFDQNDLLIFESFGKSIEKDINNAYCVLKDSLFDLYVNNLTSSLNILNELRNIALNFDENDSLFNGQSFNEQVYSINKASRWKSLIKSYVLEDLFKNIEKFDSINQSLTSFESFIEISKLNAIKRESKLIEKILFENTNLKLYLFDVFINCLLIQFDQYSYFFNEDSFIDFKDQLSTHTNSFGFRIELEKNGNATISSIIPGSYAWRTGLINYGDVILNLQLEDNKPLDLENVTIEDIINYLSIDSDKLFIRLLGKSGEQKEIELYKENTEQFENSVQTFILNGKIKVGYILLPAFYTTWETNYSNGCSQDVGRAIYSLSKENINALIIDLRNNGGGSIVEAIDLAGIFIDFGPLSIVQNAKKEFSLIKDFNRGSMFTAPLAILINKNSASASEMFAAVLQDYNRAIIIGDTSYGKSTGQSLIPISKDNKNILKVTTSNYYRVTGKSYSEIGVIPDILLPNINYSKKTDKSINGSLSSVDSIHKKPNYPFLNSLPIDLLKEYSNNTLKQNKKFNKIRLIDSLINTSVLIHEYLYLNLNKYKNYVQNNEKIISMSELIKNCPSSTFTINYMKNDIDMMNLYKYYSDLHTKLRSYVISDPYIEETLNILNFYSTINKKNNE